ncbi:hypothetical protein ACW7G2_11550 [Luteimonas sp. A277]
MIALLLGVVHFYLLLRFWGLWAAQNPLPSFLITDAGMGEAYRWVLYPVDFLTSVLLSVPLAIILLRLRPSRIWLYVVLAVLPYFAYSNAHLVGDPILGQLLPAFAFGWVMELLIVPAAVLLAGLLVRRFAPNNSFKPTPLRGAA